MASSESLTPFLGMWTFERMDDERYHETLGKQGLPWAVRKLLQHFEAAREFVQSPDGTFVFRSKMLTGSWNELGLNEPTTFSVLGYTIDTLVTWEEDCMLVSTMKTTAAEGFVSAGWTATTRITHAIEGEELCVTTIAPDGSYKMWLRRQA